MPQFKFKAVDRAGRTRQGESDAENKTALATLLKDQGLFLMEATETEAPVVTQEAPPPEKKPEPTINQRINNISRKVVPNFKFKVSLKELAIFSTQFATMIQTGIPLLDILNILADQQTNKKFKVVIQDIYHSVQHGMSLSSSFARFPNIFDGIYVSLLSAGEASGNIDTMLNRISSHLQFKRSLHSKVRSAMVYPFVVVLTSLAVIGFMLFFILPTFVALFDQFKLDLPLLTRVLIKLSEHVRQYWVVYTIAILSTWSLTFGWLREITYTKQFHSFLMKIPVVGTFIKNIVLTRTLRTMASLVSGGVPILRSIELARSAANNLVFVDIFNRVWRFASQGKGLASGFIGNPYIPQMITNMISTAEKTGTLSHVLNQISDHFEQETDASLKDLISLLEPVLVLFLGVVVGLIAAAVMMPLYQLGSGLE